jgi:hypothetical protein
MPAAEDDMCDAMRGTHSVEIARDLLSHVTTRATSGGKAPLDKSSQQVACQALSHLFLFQA